MQNQLMLMRLEGSEGVLQVQHSTNNLVFQIFRLKNFNLGKNGEKNLSVR